MKKKEEISRKADGAHINTVSWKQFVKSGLVVFRVRESLYNYKSYSYSDIVPIHMYCIVSEALYNTLYIFYEEEPPPLMQINFLGRTW